MTREELAERWECHPNTLKPLIKSGELRGKVVNQHGKLDFSITDVRNFEVMHNIPLKRYRMFVDEAMERLGVDRKKLYWMASQGLVEFGRLTEVSKKFYFHK